MLALEKKGIFLSLEATEKSLKLFGSPHRRFPAILVGGTNGKGSTVAMLTAILQAAHFRVGTYTSPHLLDIRERIRLDSKNIPQNDFSDLAKRIFSKLEEANLWLSFFEFLTVMAFLYFFEQKIDIAVVEVGLGGRWDATNVLTPLISVITSVDLDHQRFLGNTLSEIAFEKAGIIRENGIFVTAVSQPRIRSQLKKICHEKNAKGFFLGEDFFTPDQLKLSLKGEFQRLNAACALAVVNHLKPMGWTISDETVRTGLSKTIWPGRIETVQKNPTIILDGAHNPAGIRALFHSLTNEFEYDKLHIVFGVMEDKNYGEMVRRTLKFSDSFYFVELPLKRALSSTTLAFRFPELKNRIQFRKEFKDAIARLIPSTNRNDLICVTGSLYVVSEAKKYFGHSTL